MIQWEPTFNSFAFESFNLKVLEVEICTSSSKQKVMGSIPDLPSSEHILKQVVFSRRVWKYICVGWTSGDLAFYGFLIQRLIIVAFFSGQTPFITDTWCLHRCRPVRLHIRHHPAVLTSGGVHHSQAVQSHQIMQSPGSGFVLFIFSVCIRATC